MDVAKSADPQVTIPDAPTLPEIRESEAEGRIATLFSDIRATQGAGNVNYVWRHLATIPGALEFAWAASREQGHEIHAFGETIWSHSCAAVAIEPSLRPDMGELPKPMHAVLESYARGNRWNLAAVSTLLGRTLVPVTSPRRTAPDLRAAIPPRLGFRNFQRRYGLSSSRSPAPDQRRTRQSGRLYGSTSPSFPKFCERPIPPCTQYCTRHHSP